MPPRRMITEARMGELIAQRVAEALIAAGVTPNTAAGNGAGNGNGTGTGAGDGNGSGNVNESRNAQGSNPSRGCSYKEFMSCKPLPFRGTEGPVGLVRWFEKMESVFRMSHCAETDRVQYATGTLQDNALTWWNTFSQTVGIDAAIATPWEVVKNMMTAKYCPRSQVQSMEAEFWELKVKGTDIQAYTNRFQELSLLCPGMVTSELKKIERYIWGLPSQIQGMVTGAGKDSIDSVILLAHELMEQVKRQGVSARQSEVNAHDNKRKWDGSNQERNFSQTPSKRLEGNQNFAEGSGSKSGYVRRQPLCNRCERHHSGLCTVVCQKCRKTGHLSKNCRVVTPATNTDTIAPRACFECGQTGHFRSNCPEKRKDVGNH